MLDFDDVNLSDELSQLDHWQRVAFVASCVEVLIPSYVRFAELEEIGDPGMVASVIDRVWVSLGDPQGDLGRLELPSSEALLELSPEEEDWNEWAPQAENAIAALSFLVDLTRNDDPGLQSEPRSNAMKQRTSLPRGKSMLAFLMLLPGQS